MNKSADLSWQGKTLALLRARRISVRQFAKRLGRPERTVRAHLTKKNRPLGERSIVAEYAAALDVSPDWLTDGQPGDPPKTTVDASSAAALAKSVPPRFRRLAFAVADPETAEWLLAQLDLYERARRRARGGRA